MSTTTPDPNGGPHRVSHATVVVVDAATGLPTSPLTDTALRASAISVSTTQLPASLGAKTAAASLSIAPASDATFPVTVGQITSTTTTIASGQSVSGNIDLGLMRLGRIVMPTTASGWDAANLTLQTSHDGVTFNNLHDKDGAEYTITATSGRSILVPLADMLSVRYFRIRSGTSAAAVNQTASRTLTLVLVP